MTLTGSKDPGRQGAMSFAAAAGGGTGRGAQVGEVRVRDWEAQTRKPEGGGDVQQQMLMSVLKKLDAFTAAQRDTEARMDRMERGMRTVETGMRALTSGGERFVEVPVEEVQRTTEVPAEKVQQPTNPGEGLARGEGISPFEEDQQYNFKGVGTGASPFGNALEAIANESGVRFNLPDLFTPRAGGLLWDNVIKDDRERYCADLIRWMVVEAALQHPLWTPAATYSKQEHQLTFAICLQPLRPQQVTDLRSWLPPSCRTGAVSKRAIQGLLASGTIKQKKWGRGVVLYVGEEPKFRGE